MPRRDITMSDDEVEEFLSARAHMVVGVIDDDGWPTGTIVATRYADGQLTLHLPSGDQLLDVVARDPRICCTADEHGSYYDIRGVIVHGTAERGDSENELSVTIERTISFDFGRLR